MKDNRPNYFTPPHSDKPNPGTSDDPIVNGGGRYDSDLDRITEQEMVPDIVERLTVRHEIDYDNIPNGMQRFRNFKIPGINVVRLIRMIKHLFALIPRNVEQGINNSDVVIVPIQAGDVSVTIYGKANWTITRAYLASSMIDMTPDVTKGSGGLVKSGNRYIYTPTIPFKQDDELVVYYKV